MRVMLTTLLLSISIASQANTLEVFESQVVLNEDCSITVQHDASKKTIEPNFTELGKCSLMNHGKTNIPKTLYVNGMYVLFIENRLETNDTCKSEATSFGIDKNNVLYHTDYVKSFSRCNLALEAKSFEIFSAKMK